MRKIVLFILVSLLCVAAVSSTYFVLDRLSPQIEVKDTPTLSCSVTFDDLMNHASASDDKGLKSFFIEEKSLNTIAENGYLTYVAVDTSNHVKKKQVAVNADANLKNYHIEVLKPLLFQVNESPALEEYLAVQNGCGWTIRDHVRIDNVDFEKIGTYDALISSRKHSDIEALEEEVIVDDFRIPKIILNTSSVVDGSSAYYDDDYFMAFIDHTEDDKDDPASLRRNIRCDWREVLQASESGYVSYPGTYTLTYSVEDSEGFLGTAQLQITLNAPVIVETAEGE